MLPAADDTPVEAEELVEDGQGTRLAILSRSRNQRQKHMNRVPSRRKATSCLKISNPRRLKIRSMLIGVKTTIFHLRQNGCEEVTGNKLAERWKNKYGIKQPSKV